MELSEEDREIFREMAPFWEENSASAFLDKALPEGFETTLGAGVLSHRIKGNADMPTGHFSANYSKLMTEGASAIKREAQ